MGDNSERTVKLGGEEIDIGPLTRRRAIQMAAGLGVSSLAGCSQGGGDNTTESTTTEETTEGETTDAGTVTDEGGTVKLVSSVP